MPQYNKTQIATAAVKYGFLRDTFEKVLRLKKVLEFFNQEELLSQHLALKGGTAINLTIFNLPRLSIDIDVDYIPNDSRKDMLCTREKITETIQDYMIDEGYSLSDNSRFSHSLDAFNFQYLNCGGNREMLKIEINYSLRSHVLEPESRMILTEAFAKPVFVLTVHPAEIFAAKANALISRAAARDLYDFNNFIRAGLFFDQKDFLRKTIIFYATVSAKTVNRNFNLSAIDTLDFGKIRRDLFPVLTRREATDNFELDYLKDNVKTYLKTLMTVTPLEDEYMEKFINGEYCPELLFSDKAILDRIKNHPMALWKCKAER